MKFKVGDRVKMGVGKGMVTAISGGKGKALIDIVGKNFETCRWEDEVSPARQNSRKEIRRSLKSLKADLLQLACEAGCKDRILGEQIDKMADDVRELIEKI